jgi:hypothetical protein
MGVHFIHRHSRWLTLMRLTLMSSKQGEWRADTVDLRPSVPIRGERSLLQLRRNLSDPGTSASRVLIPARSPAHRDRPDRDLPKLDRHPALRVNGPRDRRRRSSLSRRWRLRRTRRPIVKHSSRSLHLRHFGSGSSSPIVPQHGLRRIQRIHDQHRDLVPIRAALRQSFLSDRVRHVHRQNPRLRKLRISKSRESASHQSKPCNLHSVRFLRAIVPNPFTCIHVHEQLNISNPPNNFRFQDRAPPPTAPDHKTERRPNVSI